MDIKALMRQAQEVQKKMQKAQEELATAEYEGSAGGGVVQVVMTGAGLSKKVTIDKSLIQEDEIDILEDLLVAAFNDAKAKVDAGSSDSMRDATAGMPLPPGCKM